VPVLYNDFFEGTMGYLTPFDADVFFAPLQVSDNYWFGISHQSNGWGMKPPQDWIVNTSLLKQYDLELIYATNPLVFVQYRNRYLVALLEGIGISVVIAFMLVFFLGKRLLVSPYEKLAESEHRLATQTKILIDKEAEAGRLAKVARYMLDAIVMTDEKGKITWVNDAFEALSGYQAKEVLGKKPGTFLQGASTDASVVAEMRASIEQQRACQSMLINYTKDNTPYWVEISLVPLFSSQSKHLEGFIAVERDISERVEMQQQLKRAAFDAEAANIAKSQFLASMSHELRTPMNGVMGIAQLLEQTSLNAEQKELLDTLLSSSKHMLKLLNDILDFSKVEAGKLEIEPVNFSLNDLVSRVESTYQALSTEKGLEFRIEIAGDANAIIFADETRITQVIMNLLSNAFKFTKNGHVLLNIDMLTQQGAHLLEFEVIDTGIGIAEHKQSTIFDPFIQAERDTTRKFGGTGLGLAITKKLVSAMKGEIQVESQVDVGTRFNVLIPVKIRAKIDEEAQQPSLEGSGQFDGSGLHALIVDDNKVNVLVLTKFLKKRGFSCECASDGQQGVEMAIAKKYDVIMMDNHMPIMDGTTATAKIKALDSEHANTTIIACTADAFEENRQKMISVGCADIITKPIKVDELDRCLYKVLENRSKSHVLI
jgi:PAS domain S-box-containing protein